jgi:tetratricopeptide (TPR) repeat protein
MDQKKYRKAYEEYKQALGGDSQNEELLIKTARACDADKWYGQSVEHWETYIKQFPNGKHIKEAKEHAAQNRRWIGVHFYQMGDELDKVETQIKKAMEWDPELYDAYYWMGRIYMEKGKFEDAVKMYEKALKIKPDDKVTAWLIKDTRGRLENGDKAYESYSKGYEQYEKGNLDEALKLYKKAAEANPKFSDAHFWVARILQEQGKFKQSVAAWDTVLDLDPNNKRAQWFRNQAVKQKK